MKKFKILSLVLAVMLSVTLLPVSALALTEPDITAPSAIVVDMNSGEVYYEKGAGRKIQPASTTKLVTALLVVEAVERGEIALTDTVTAYNDCDYNLDEDSTNAEPQIQPGETMTVEDLLYCAMLVSANEACNILAEYVSGTIADFVEDMNARAESLGCVNTHFANANGLENENHYSTAADFALFAREAMAHSIFQRICGTHEHTVPATNMAEERRLVNTNSLIDPDSEYYSEYAYGIKTGFFTNAGYCLASAASKDDIDIICVVMGSAERGDNFADTLLLYQFVFDNYEYRQVLSSTETILTIPVDMGTAETVGVRAEDVISVILPSDYDITRIGYKYVLYHEAAGETLTAPVNAGEVLGEVTVVELDENRDTIRTLGTSQLVAASSIEMSRGEYLRTQARSLLQTTAVRRIVTILIILLALYLLLVVYYHIRRVRHMHSVRAAKRKRAQRMTRENAQWLSIPGEEEEEKEFLPTASSHTASREAGAPRESTSPRRRSTTVDDDFFDSFFKD